MYLSKKHRIWNKIFIKASDQKNNNLKDHKDALYITSPFLFLQKLWVAYRGPPFSLLSRPSFTSASTPTPVMAEFSSLAIKTATTVDFNFGFVSPNFFISSVTRATCPKQSVVPRPRSFSPSMLNENGSNSCKFGHHSMNNNHYHIKFTVTRDWAKTSNLYSYIFSWHRKFN